MKLYKLKKISDGLRALANIKNYNRVISLPSGKNVEIIRTIIPPFISFNNIYVSILKICIYGSWYMFYIDLSSYSTIDEIIKEELHGNNEIDEKVFVNDMIEGIERLCTLIF